MKSFKDRKVVSNTRAFAARQIVLVPLRFLRLLLVLPLLEPNELFLIRLAGTGFGYVNRVSLGTFAALGLYYPAEEQLGQHKNCATLQFNAWFFAVVGSVVGGIVGTVLAVLFFETQLWPLVIFWGITVAPAKYVQASLLARGRYKSLALIDVVAAIVSFAVCIVGILFLGFWGFVIGLVFAAATPLGFGKGYWLPKNPKDKAKAISYIYSSGNLWASGTLADLAKTFDIVLLAMFVIGNSEIKGAYALGVILSGLAVTLVVSINNVLRRELIRENATNKGKSSFQDVKMYVYVDFLIWISLIALMFLLLHPLFWFVPKYANTIEVAPFLIIGSMLLQLRFYPTAILNVNKLFRWDQAGWLLSLVFGLATFFLINISMEDKNYLALSRVAAGLTTFLVMWLGFLRFQQASFRPFFGVVAEVTILAVWVLGIKLTFSFPILNFIIILIGWGSFFGYFKWRSPQSLQFVMHLIFRARSDTSLAKSV